MKKQLISSLQKSTYSAKNIQVLEGLDPVRLRPGMYIGGVDKKAMHHLIIHTQLRFENHYILIIAWMKL